MPLVLINPELNSLVKVKPEWKLPQFPEIGDVERVQSVKCAQTEGGKSKSKRAVLPAQFARVRSSPRYLFITE